MKTSKILTEQQLSAIVKYHQNAKMSSGSTKLKPLEAYIKAIELYLQDSSSFEKIDKALGFSFGWFARFYYRIKSLFPEVSWILINNDNNNTTKSEITKLHIFEEIEGLRKLIKELFSELNERLDHIGVTLPIADPTKIVEDCLNPFKGFRKNSQNILQWIWDTFPLNEPILLTNSELNQKRIELDIDKISLKQTLTYIETKGFVALEKEHRSIVSFTLLKAVN